MTNLLKETLSCLDEHGKTINDIKFIVMKNYKMRLDNFIEIADIEYDSGYGLQEIESSLVIYGEDWHMYRQEYDGSESWSFVKTPNQDKLETYKFKSLKY